MAAVINSRIRKKDKMTGGGKESGRGYTCMSVSKCVLCECVLVCGKRMKRETDRQNCMS